MKAYHPSRWDDFLIDLAYKLPRRLVYWCGIRVFSEATHGQFKSTEAGAIPMMDALVAWERKQKP